jgi:hypothetical protein
VHCGIRTEILLLDLSFRLERLRETFNQPEEDERKYSMVLSPGIDRERDLEQMFSGIFFFCLLLLIVFVNLLKPGGNFTYDQV